MLFIDAANRGTLMDKIPTEARNSVPNIF